MRGSRIARTLVALALAVTSSGPWIAFAQSGGAQPPAAAVTPDPWPKIVKQGGATYTVYQPQLDSWDGFNAKAHAAVSVEAPASQTPVYGAIRVSAKTRVDRLARTVYFTNTKVESANFPSAPTLASSYQQAIQSLFVKG